MGQNLTTLQNFKTWYNLSGVSADDAVINNMISAASFAILSFLDRKSLFFNTYQQYFNGNGGFQMQMPQWPVLAVNTVNIDSNPVLPAVQPNAGYFMQPWDGWPPGRPQFLALIGASRNFTQGNMNCFVEYEAGYAIQNEAATIPVERAYQVQNALPYGNWGQDDGVTFAADGTALTMVAKTPLAGQYSVTNGLYNFAADDAGKDVLIDYSFIPAPVEQACWEMVGERYAYRQHIGQKSHSVQGNTTVSFDNSGMTPFIMDLLQPYKRMTPF